MYFHTRESIKHPQCTSMSRCQFICSFVTFFEQCLDKNPWRSSKWIISSARMPHWENIPDISAICTARHIEGLPHIWWIMLFQYNEEPVHYVQDIHNYLSITFPRRWIGRCGSVGWIAHFPDLSCLDFFLPGQLKSLMEERPNESSKELVARLLAAAREV